MEGDEGSMTGFVSNGTPYVQMSDGRYYPLKDVAALIAMEKRWGNKWEEDPAHAER